LLDPKSEPNKFKNKSVKQLKKIVKIALKVLNCILIISALSSCNSFRNTEKNISQRNFSFELKLSTEDTLDYRGFFILELDTNKQETKILCVKAEGYKIFQKNELYCQELNRIEKNKCNAKTKSLIEHISEGVKRHPELIEKEILKREGLRISKFYRVRIIPNKD
jgi:hypothetical protein